MKKILSLFIVLTMMLQPVLIANAAEEESETAVEIHVSPNGLDSNAGTEQSPIKTLAEAKKRVRNKNNGKTDIDVIFHEGEYRITETLELTSDDSGTAEHPVEYKAAEGEKAVFKGSVELDASKFSKIENQNVYNRLHDKAKDKVAVLDLKAQGITNLATLFAGSYGSYSTGYNNFYLDGIVQPLARWPNNKYANITKTIDANKGIFRVDDATASRWGEAEDPRIAGLICWDWAYERTEVTAVDPSTRYVTMNVKNTISKKISNANARYFIYNLLEEIDEPGEWYIDKENMLLYYYPMYPVNDAKFEMSVLQIPMINMTGVSYVNFEGLEFCQTTNDVMAMTQCHDIIISGCNFHDIGRSAINAGNTTNPDNVRNIIIENNIFTRTELRTLYLTGGSEETLESSGNIIRNNYFSHFGTIKRSYEGAMRIDGVGFLVENNTMCYAPHTAIQLGGSLNKIKYNEIYDVCKDSNDMGAIYTGRIAYRRGHEISYNYIHDLVPREGLAGLLCGVYFDDSQSGGEMHHNIFENVPRAVFYNGGNDAYVHDNIIIDSKLGAQFSYTANETVNQHLFIDAIAYADAHPVYYEKFPELKDIDINYTKSHNNRVINNLMVNAFGNSMTALDDPEWSTDPNNVNYARQNLSYNNVSVASVAEFDGFNDPENGDFTIKEGAQILETHPELGNIKLSQIGVQWDAEKEAEKEEFIKIYPKNGETNVNASNLYLKWQPSNYRTIYHVKVANDKELKNIVYEGTTKENYIYIDGIESGGKTYYWNVTAEDGFATLDTEEKTSYGAVYSFVTSRTDKLEQVILTDTIKKADTLLQKVTAGDGSGQCDAKILEEFNVILSEAKTVNAKKYGSQLEVDEMNEKLDTALSKLPASINKGYAGMDNWLSSIDNWQGAGVTLENGVLTVPNGAMAMTNDMMTTYEIYKFKVKTTNFDTGYFTISLKINSFGTPYSPGMVNYGFYFKESIIEFQRYSSGGGILETKENNGLMKSGEWADIEVGAIDVEGGVQVYLKLNGEELFNYFDDTGLVSSDGYMQFSVHGKAEDVQVMSAGELPEFDTGIVMGGNFDYNDILYSTYTSADFEGNVLKQALKSNEVAEVKAVFNLDETGQSITVGDGDSGYMIYVTDDLIKLVRSSKKGNQILYIGKNKDIKSGESVTLNLGAIRAETGTRVLLYVNGKRVIDCMDMYKGITGGGLTFSDDNKKGMSVQ